MKSIHHYHSLIYFIVWLWPIETYETLECTIRAYFHFYVYDHVVLATYQNTHMVKPWPDIDKKLLILRFTWLSPCLPDLSTWWRDDCPPHHQLTTGRGPGKSRPEAALTSEFWWLNNICFISRGYITKLFPNFETRMSVL